MKKIGIIVKKGVPEAISTVRDLLSMLDRKEFRVFVEDEAASILKIKGYPRQQIPSKSDVIIAFGGDGTLLSVARLVGNKGIPILGVNLGGLGFITEVARDEIRDKGVLDRIFSGKCSFEERIVLSSDVYRKGRRVAHNTALNDVVLNNSALARMIKLDISINNKHVTTFRADGLIISTPTGSTAHSLSAGGPILYPTLGSFVMTPICPHTLANRPIVLPDEFVLDVDIRDGKGVHLTLDGQVGFPLRVNDKLKIKKSNFKTKLLLLHDRDYFRVLRAKLKWGE
ncbi:MAG TPA: NAD(+)/NADH kinase [Nitrospirae bacterium]|nr:putative inorganic polyphosphate/ATP-NAD kinase [bacterium BMS3Abin10]GBE38662.1 putative inorganic polyphosphate/ATP-NAD kinase [bacterium BMS3Bbin08]HDH50571.1 NAD(+)/NADH kinase [Nitrospirota bacterium]HDK16448.1 NAD(+)/NADH kinase [Nitrospirota bacterium]HDK41720.1 NAD(+)/NADH kinase [Nitrospirota bacterium]